MLPQAKAAAAGHHIGAHQHSGLQQQRASVLQLCVWVCVSLCAGPKKGGKKEEETFQNITAENDIFSCLLKRY